MGFLIEKTELNRFVTSDGLVEYFKKNSIEMVDYYSKSTKECLNVSVKNIKTGGFYHLISQNKSNWMRNSPVFVADYKKVGTTIIILAVNMNLIPLQIRTLFFDKFITEKDFEKDSFLKVSFTGIYNELKNIGFEYSLMEFDVSKILIAHKISMSILPKFLISQHPTNTYDPKKLSEIWKSKIGKQAERDAEMQSSSLEDFYNIHFNIDSKYESLKKHIERLRRNL